MRIEPAKRDHYRVLGVPRGASMDEIRRAYWRLARKHHPDITREPGTGEYFTALTSAYEVLHDPAKRACYDQAGHVPGSRDRPGRDGWQRHRWDNSDLGADAVRGASRPVRGRDRRAVLELSEREAAQLAYRSITVQAGGYTIILPAGIRAGAQLRLIGAGEHGSVSGPPGDLLLTVQAPSSSLPAVGASLIDLSLSPAVTSNSPILLPGGRFLWQ
jgi:curved DNA-binding protein